MTIDLDALYVSVHDYIVAVLGIDGAKVIPAEEDAPRPSLPYISVRSIVPVAREGFSVDSRIEEGSHPTATVKRVGPRRATYSLIAYGAAAAAWLPTLEQHRDAVAGQTAQDAENIVVRFLGGVSDLTGYLDDTIERRWNLDIEVTYLSESDTAPHPEMDTLSADYTGGTLTQTVTFDF